MAFPRTAFLTLAVPFLFLTATPVAAQDALVYQTPNQTLVDIVDAPPTPTVLLSPDQETLLLAQRPSLPPISELAERELRLAGFRIKPRINGQSRTSFANGFRLVNLDGTERAVEGLPAQPRFENVQWSPDGSKILFTQTGDTGIELWVIDVATALASRLTKPVVSLTAEASPKWVGNDLVACLVVPEGRGPEPPESTVPTGPVVQENLGGKNPARTYQDLLANPHDEALFDYYFTTRLALVDLEGKIRWVGATAVFSDFDPSPDGTYLLVEMLHRPYSYVVPAERFPIRTEIWDLDGNRRYSVADLPLAESVPVAFGSVRTGRRSCSWRNDAAADLVWVEAQDGGDAAAEADVRDRVFVLRAPFLGEPEVLIDLAQRFRGITWGDDDLALVHSWWWKTRNVKSWRVSPGTPGEPRLLWDRSWQDVYSDPGDPVTVANAYGRRVMRTADRGGKIFLMGQGASEEGNRPFFDVLDLETGTADRRFRSEAPYYEQPVAMLDDAGQRLLVRRESVETPPNYYIRDLAGGELKALTAFPHPTPQLAGIQKELVKYQRADGVQLTGTLYLPAGYKPSDGPLPMVIWAYPTEFKDADAAGQVTDSPYRFDRVGWYSPLLWLPEGYAVFDNPTMPIIGEGDVEPNDTYVEQLVASAKAAIDYAAGRGVADPRRVAIGGHSYGAFMTANLLAHSDLFAAGIARSGAYNRSLTPFGFQSEERTFWQAPEVYFTMSPFMHADKINEPLLMIHGEADNNPGTFPMQSERMFDAMKGLGGTCRLVMLPYESHGYRGRESVLHMLWESERWLERYVKNRPPGNGGADSSESDE